MARLQKDIYLGVGLAAVFAVILLFVIPKAIVVPSNIKILSLRPDFWPMALCVTIIVFSLSLVVITCFENRNAERSPEKPEPYSKKTIHFGPAITKPLIVIGGLLAYYYAVEPFGIILSSILALFGLAVLYGERKFTTLIPLAILLPIILYFFFSKVANVPLPTGFLFG